MTVSELVQACLKTEKMTKAEFCRRVGWSAPNVAGRLKRDPFSAAGDADDIFHKGSGGNE